MAKKIENMEQNWIKYNKNEKLKKKRKEKMIK